MKSRERWGTQGERHSQGAREGDWKAAGEWQTSRGRPQPGGPSLEAPAWRPGSQVNAAPRWPVSRVSLFCKRPGSGHTGLEENLSKASCQALYGTDYPGFQASFPAMWRWALLPPLH